MSERGGSGSPKLTGSALEAVRHRGSHLQIIASAGAGKTEVVSQRVVDLLADGVAPEAIVAFTFTARAAEELKNRIVQRVEGRLGKAALGRLERSVRRHDSCLLLSPTAAAGASIRDVRRT
ncbi:UvrD-helicase domain-containing protein [Micromonospora inaquosa]|uniref:UvrD-helicase domain-containing protein n=1 Tax=Micromonospora inaquosa TaxID=2203716 RepID=UPI0033D0C28F